MNILKNLEDKVNIMGKELVNFRVNTEAVKKPNENLRTENNSPEKIIIWALQQIVYTHAKNQ